MSREDPGSAVITALGELMPDPGTLLSDLERRNVGLRNPQGFTGRHDEVSEFSGRREWAASRSDVEGLLEGSSEPIS